MSIQHIEAKKFLRAIATGDSYADTSVLVTKDWSVSVYQGDKEDIQLGFDPQDTKQKTQSPNNVFDVTFDTVGSGVVATPPPGLSSFFKAAGALETVTALSDVTYTKQPLQSAIGSVDIEGRGKEPVTGKDFVYSTTGAKGTVGVSFTEKGYVEWKANKFVGDYIRPSAETAVGLDYGTQKSYLALPANGETILVYQIGGQSLCVSSMDIPVLWYGDATRRSLPGGCVSTSLSEGILEGSFTMLDEDFDVFNIYTNLDTGTETSFLVTMGTVAGSMCDISNARIQITDVQPASIDDLAAQQVSFRMLDENVVKFY